MSRKAILVMLTTPLLVALAAGCGGSSKSSSNSPTEPPAQQSGGQQSGQQAQPTSKPSSGGSQSTSNDLKTTVKNLADAKSYRVTMTVENGGTTQETITEEYVAPDRYHIVVSGGAIGNTEIIRIGSDTYFKLGGTWTKSPVAVGNSFNPSDVNSAVNNAGDWNGVTKGGTETVNGQKCQIYTYKSGDTSGQACITGTGLPVQFISQSGSNKTTLNFSDFNANIEIKAPI